jgi:hypothetical protein
MKKILVLFFLMAIAFACKKEEPTPVPNPSPAPTSVYPISVKVNDTLKRCSLNCYSGIHSGGFRDLTLDLAGSAEQVILSWQGIPMPGNYSLVHYGEPYVKYGKGSFVYGAKQGLLSITSIDTAANGAVNKITASFNFKTDTVNGLFFELTEGAITIK